MKSTAETRTKSKRPTPLKESEVKKFLAKYKKAWETRDADLAASLFTRDAHYRQDPFTAPITGREAIHDYWAGATSRQEDIHFNAGTVVHSGYLVAVEWTCSYKESSTGDRKELGGMFLADFYGEQIRVFREYWHSQRR